MTGWKELLVFTVISYSGSLGQNSSNCPKILTKSQWNGRSATEVNYLITPLQYVLIHHTVTPGCESTTDCSTRVKNIQDYHMDTNGWSDIGYSFLIGGDGNVYEGVGWSYEGAHTYGYNKKSVGIAFIGSFQNTPASDKMVEAAHKLILCGKSQGYLRNDVRVIAGRQIIETLSPGQQLYNQIQKWPEWASTP